MRWGGGGRNAGYPLLTSNDALGSHQGRRNLKFSASHSPSVLASARDTPLAGSKTRSFFLPRFLAPVYSHLRCVPETSSQPMSWSGVRKCSCDGVEHLGKLISDDCKRHDDHDRHETGNEGILNRRHAGLAAGEPNEEPSRGWQPRHGALVAIVAFNEPRPVIE
jgi:hypothetical protein